MTDPEVAELLADVVPVEHTERERLLGEAVAQHLNERSQLPEAEAP